LGEVPTGLQLGGGVLIVAGVALVRLDELRSTDDVEAALDASPELETAPA
jgi:drug/metabolite transporter (DMT)-like permease